jgi:hypothetical protein
MLSTCIKICVTEDSEQLILVRFQILTSDTMKITVLWDVAPCCLIEVCRCFKGAYCLHHQVIIAMMMEVVITSETSTNFYQTTRRNIPEDSSLHNLFCPNFLLASTASLDLRGSSNRRLKKNLSIWCPSNCEALSSS